MLQYCKSLGVFPGFLSLQYNLFVVYISVICGVLGFALLLVLLGWILNEMLVFGDPIYEVIQSISTRSHSSSRNGNTTEIMLPRARNKREYPLWLYHDRSERNIAETNGAFGKYLMSSAT